MVDLGKLCCRRDPGLTPTTGAKGSFDLFGSWGASCGPQGLQFCGDADTQVEGCAAKFEIAGGACATPVRAGALRRRYSNPSQSANKPLPTI